MSNSPSLAPRSDSSRSSDRGGASGGADAQIPPRRRRDQPCLRPDLRFAAVDDRVRVIRRRVEDRLVGGAGLLPPSQSISASEALSRAAKVSFPFLPFIVSAPEPPVSVSLTE